MSSNLQDRSVWTDATITGTYRSRRPAATVLGSNTLKRETANHLPHAWLFASSDSAGSRSRICRSPRAVWGLRRRPSAGFPPCTHVRSPRSPRRRPNLPPSPKHACLLHTPVHRAPSIFRASPPTCSSRLHSPVLWMDHLDGAARSAGMARGKSWNGKACECLVEHPDPPQTHELFSGHEGRCPPTSCIFVDNHSTTVLAKNASTTRGESSREVSVRLRVASRPELTHGVSNTTSIVQARSVRALTRPPAAQRAAKQHNAGADGQSWNMHCERRVFLRDRPELTSVVRQCGLDITVRCAARREWQGHDGCGRDTTCSSASPPCTNRTGTLTPPPQTLAARSIGRRPERATRACFFPAPAVCGGGKGAIACVRARLPANGPLTMVHAHTNSPAV